MNSNSTIRSSVSRILFKRDYFTVSSFNENLKMKRCGNKLIRRNAWRVENMTEEGIRVTNARNVM